VTTEPPSRFTTDRNEGTCRPPLPPVNRGDAMDVTFR